MPDTLAQKVRAKYPGAYDDLSDQELESKVRAKFPGVYDDIPSTQSAPAGPRQPASAEQFMTPEDIANRDMTGMDIVKGAVKGLGRSAVSIADLAASSRMFPGMADSLEAARPTIDAYTTNENDAQRLGGTIETVAEMAVPVSRVKAAIPSTARAGAKFNAIAKVANDIPVDLQAPGNVALRIADLAQRGGGTNWGPAPVRQFIQWATDPKKQPMTYEVAKDFASNISKLSAKETMALPDSMKAQIHELRVVLNKAVGEAAAKVGKGQDYAAAMTEYAKAKKMQRLFLESMKYALPAAGITGAGMWLSDKLMGNK